MSSDSRVDRWRPQAVPAVLVFTAEQVETMCRSVGLPYDPSKGLELQDLLTRPAALLAGGCVMDGAPSNTEVKARLDQIARACEDLGKMIAPGGFPLDALCVNIGVPFSIENFYTSLLQFKSDVERASDLKKERISAAKSDRKRGADKNNMLYYVISELAKVFERMFLRKPSVTQGGPFDRFVTAFIQTTDEAQRARGLPPSPSLKAAVDAAGKTNAVREAIRRALVSN
jgi:hypothetical protein